MSNAPHSETSRLEAFSDGVFAIIITIMVLELKVPHGGTLQSLVPVLPVFLSYVLSFLYLAIYWNNHHHLLHATEVITGGILWANMHLLFWLSLIPFATDWVGQSHGQSGPATLYGFILLMAACAYFILQRAIIYHQGKHSTLGKALGSDRKGQISILCYVLAIGGAFLSQWIAYAFFVLVAMMWIIPDRRLVRFFDHTDKSSQ